jgi:hypothetical protein
MGKMIIAIDIEIGSKDFKSEFEWQGGEHEIRNVINLVERMADNSGISCEAFTHSTLRYMSSVGWRSDPNEQEAQKMAVLYTVLQWPTDRGAICNYAAREDIEAVLMVRDAVVTVQLKGNLMASNAA